MKLLNTLFVIVFFVPILTASCRKDASYASLPEFKQKIVVNAFLSPDQAVNDIYISSTKKEIW